jgi:2-amino-4-hydroxy-6-hydroxymethyldihydropteridine diphosphokinase
MSFPENREQTDYSEFAFIALGSNLGDSRKVIHGAMDRLETFSATPLLRSSLIETDPVDCPPGSPKFINAVVGLKPLSGETPESLLVKLQSLEKEFGRLPKTIFNEPRPLDLDLIYFKNETLNNLELILPHPRAHMRQFVLAPLAEIAPTLHLNPGDT